MDNTPILNDSQALAQEDELAATLQNLSNEEIIEVFIEGLIIDKGLENLSEEEKDDIRDELNEKLTDFLTQALVNALPEDKVNELDNMIDNGAAGPENVKRLLDDAGVDSGKVVVDALQKFRELYLNSSDNQVEE